MTALRERFLAKVQKTESCWLWTAATDRKGYGRVSVRGRNRLAHRVAYELFTGKLQASDLVCHTCDTPNCVNPTHLFVGTNQDNMDDMKAKGRQNKCRGVAHGRSKLTKQQVLKIRHTYAQGSASHRKLAAEYNVSRAAIRDILNGKHWSHLGGPS